VTEVDGHKVYLGIDTPNRNFLNRIANKLIEIKIIHIQNGNALTQTYCEINTSDGCVIWAPIYANRIFKEL